MNIKAVCVNIVNASEDVGWDYKQTRFDKVLTTQMAWMNQVPYTLSRRAT